MNNPYSIADNTFGIGKQARAVLALLEQEPAFAEYVDGRYDVEVSTWAWYNGRENGVALTMNRIGYRGCLVVVFAEHRNTDHVFVDTWKMTHRPLNGPSLEDFTEAAYRNRQTFPYGAAGQAAEHIYNLLAAGYKGLIKFDTKANMTTLTASEPG